MTQRLYYHDATQREFDAHILEQQPAERGINVRLDKTAFYPTSGGQPHDTGTLNGIPVLDVWDTEQGDIWHLVKETLSQTDVHGTIDWPRRFDHTQQHTGQHLLSAAFIEQLNAMTIGFHLGRDSSTIDLDIAQLSWSNAARVEADVNRIIFENRPVTVQIVSQDQLDTLTLPLRKAPHVAGDIRIVGVQDYDASACGGTHVSHTGAIGMVKITGIERYKGGVRVSFLCGQRTLKDYARALTLLRTASQTLTVGQDDLTAAITRIQDEVKSTRRALHKAEAELMTFEAERLWAETPETGGVRRIIAHWKERSFANIRTVATQLREKPHTLVFLAVTETKGVRLVCARSDDLPTINAANLLRTAAGKLGGRGGGLPTLAQGGAQLHPPEEILQVLQHAVQHAAPPRHAASPGGE